jgi:hypothetical protein
VHSSSDTTETEMSYEEFCDLAMDLEIYHSVFSKLWNIATPVFIKGTGTAYVAFDKENRMIKFAIDPDFWESLDRQTKLFVVSHECLHIILNHGIRAKDIDPALRKVANVAMDVVVNHMLIDQFGFHRAMIKNQENLCWVDTVFRDEPVAAGQGFETYYNLLKSGMDINMLPSLLDIHDFLNDIRQDDSDGPLDDEMQKAIADKLGKSLSDSEIKDFIEKIGKIPNPGGGIVGEPQVPGDLKERIRLKSIVRKKKWESVIKKWTAYSIGEAEEYQWALDHRRFTALAGGDLSFPQLAEIESKNFEKIDLMFFLDASGSCWHLKDRFFTAALSLNPKKFNVRMFTRTTEVREIMPDQIKNLKITGGGSDDFSCMERFIQNDIKTGRLKKYPDAVFHITDGVDCSGVLIAPEKPQNWHWFLIEPFDKRWIPKNSKIYRLSDFE